MSRQILPWCRHYTINNMPPTHGCDAPLVVLGEAPGRNEEEDEHGRPFVGKSGWIWEQWMKDVGIRRYHCYIDNTYPFRPPNNKLELIGKAERDEYGRACLFRLRRQNPLVIVPMGNYALRLLFDSKDMNISDWRGSILNWEHHKVIPTFHPAVTFRQKVLEKLCRADWTRISTELQRGREFDLPKRRHVIDPTKENLDEFDRMAREWFERPYDSSGNMVPPVLAVDVENFIKTKELYCVGFAFSPEWSITVSTLRRDYHTDDDFNTALQYIIKWLTCGWPIVGLNLQTDLWKLVQWNPLLRDPLIDSYTWDLMELAHMLDPNDGGGTEEGSEDEMDEGGIRIGMFDMATLQSLHTREPYHKHLNYGTDWATKLRYNGLDCCVTVEIFNSLWKIANERGLV